MVSIDLNVPTFSFQSIRGGGVTVTSCSGLREGVLVQGPLFRPLHGPSSVYQGHGSSFGHASQSWSQDSEVFG